MDSIKISGQSANSVRQSQTVAKERDEGFIASQNSDAQRQSEKINSIKKNIAHSDSDTNSEFDTPSNILVEQRKQELAQQVSEKAASREQADKFEELSVQRKLESRSAVNSQKINNSYNVVQQDNNEQKVEQMRAEKSDSAKSSEMTKGRAPEPINLVV